MIIYRYISIVSLLCLALLASNDIWSMEQSNSVSEEMRPIDTLLFQAVKKGSLEQVKQALEEGANINAQDKNGWTALMYAASEGHANVATLLFDYGADVNMQDTQYGWTALMRAAYAGEKGRIAVINLLLNHGADINVQTKQGWTALMTMVDRNDSTAVNLLLAHGGADVNIQNDKGRTALMYAGYADMITLLLNHGANIHIQNKQGMTALLMEVKEWVDNIKAIVEYDKDLFSDQEDRRDCVESLFEFFSRINTIIETRYGNDTSKALEMLWDYLDENDTNNTPVVLISHIIKSILFAIENPDNHEVFNDNIRTHKDTYMHIVDWYMHIMEVLIAHGLTRGITVYNKGDFLADLNTLRSDYKKVKMLVHENKESMVNYLMHREIGNKKLLVRKIKDSKKRSAEDAALDENNNNNKKQATE